MGSHFNLRRKLKKQALATLMAKTVRVTVTPPLQTSMLTCLQQSLESDFGESSEDLF